MANFDQISTQTAVSELIFSENQPQIDESALPHTRRGSYGNQGSSVISENHTTANPAASIPLERLLAEIGKLVDEFVAGAHARLNTRSRVITNQIDRETEIRSMTMPGRITTHGNCVVFLTAAFGSRGFFTIPSNSCIYDIERAQPWKY
jgi:hypothetical protein